MTAAQLKAAALGLAIVLAVAFAIAALYGSYQHGVTVTDLRWKSVFADAQNLQAKALAAATTTNRAEEQRRQAEIDQAGNNGKDKRLAAAGDGVVADAAGQRLHQSADQFAARAGSVSCDSSAIERGKAATGAAMVLSDLFQRADHRAGELAKELDASRVAGLVCESSYDALRKTPAQPLQAVTRNGSG